MHIYIKFVAIIAFCFIIFALGIVAITPPAAAYELSIYDAYPQKFWYSLIISIACGVGILIHQAFFIEKSKSWITGLSIVTISNLIIIMLPIFRGYFINSHGDEISHLGMIKDIALTGHLGVNNHYPISHILSYELSVISGLDSRLVIKIIPPLFYLIYFYGLCLFTSIICRSFGQILIVMAFGSVLLFTYFNNLFLPTQLFLYLLPLVLYLFFRKTNSIGLPNAVIFVIFLIMMPFLHPLGALFLIGIFLVLGLSIGIYDTRNSHFCWGHTLLALKPAVSIFIIFLAWFINFAYFKFTFNKAYGWFVEGHGTPAIDTTIDLAGMYNLSIAQFVNLIIMTYGHSLIFSFLSLIAIFVISKTIFSQNHDITVYEIFLPLLFIIFSAFYIFSLLGDFIVTGNSQRIFCWALMASTVLNGLVFHDLILDIKKLGNNIYTITCIGLFAVIITTTILGIFSVYPSPHIMQGNFQVTMMDWVGIIWFFDHKNNDNTIHFYNFPSRASHYLYGYWTPKPESVGYFSEIPPHLGYDEHESLANSFKSNKYLVITNKIKVIKESLWPYSGKYTLSDLNLISSDSNVIKVYSNGGLDICRILVHSIS